MKKVFIKIEKFKLEQIKNTLRLTKRIITSTDETCYDRQLKKSADFIEESLKNS